MAAGLIFLLAVLLLLGLGLVLILASSPRGRGYPSCGKCGYDVSGSIGTVARCPECGSAFAAVGIMPPRGKRSPVLLASGVALIVLAIGCPGSSLLFRQAAASRAEAARAPALAAQQAAQAQAAAAGNEQPSEAESDTPAPPVERE